MSQQNATISIAEFKLSEYNMFDYMPNWVYPLVGTTEERASKLRDPNVRAAMKRDVQEAPSFKTDWSRTKVLQVVHERNYQYEGLTIKELAGITGNDPLDAWLDLALDEDLETEFSGPSETQASDDEELRGRLIKNPYVHISVSDGGAHTRFLTNSLWPAHFLTNWIRDKELMSLEQAHYKMSAYPAWFADFKNRGTLRLGDWADVIVYDKDELGYLYQKPIFATDFPGGERRLVQKPTGLRYTIVNGTVTFEGNDCTGALPGKSLRSYDMVG